MSDKANVIVAVYQLPVCIVFNMADAVVASNQFQSCTNKVDVVGINQLAETYQLRVCTKETNAPVATNQFNDSTKKVDGLPTKIKLRKLIIGFLLQHRFNRSWFEF